MTIFILLIDVSLYLNIVILNSFSNIILATINFQIMTILHITEYHLIIDPIKYILELLIEKLKKSIISKIFIQFLIDIFILFKNKISDF